MAIEFDASWLGPIVDESDPFRVRVVNWAARVLNVDVEDIRRIETDWWGLCDTCEYSEGEIMIVLADGRKYYGTDTFGLFLRDIVELDLNEDGTPSGYAHGRELFTLELQAAA